ncbi:hypothetical protein [Selenomonas sp. AB3002]|uniref:hypothetical protein n=1 Tax=Selenomonas sp. AB3002 TaxID=1392502 RepID=UPI0004978CF3
MVDNFADNNVGMDWNDTIENDGQEFIILPEGDYNFVITNFERGRFPGSAKLQACNKAVLTLQVETDKGPASIRTDLLLNRMLEFRISAFFRCIGRKKHGEKLAMDWNNLIGAKGRARFKPRDYVDKDGNKKQANDVDRFYDYDEKFFPKDTTGFGGIPERGSNIPF